MKINNGKIFIKSFSFLLLLYLISPLVDIEKFYIFIFILTVIIFSQIRDKIHYFRLMPIILILILIKFLQSYLYFNEGNNILILNEKSKGFYQNFLPSNMFSFLVEEYDFYKTNSKCKDDDSKCWKSFDPKEESANGSPFFLEYSPSMNLDFQNIKYSRKIKDLNIRDIKTARISEINNLRYNYFWLDKFDVVRENMPFFIMIEIPEFLLNSKICWKGNIFWQLDNKNFEHLINDNFLCKKIENKDLNKKIYAVSLGKSTSNNDLNYLYGDSYIKENDKLDNFLNKNELIIKLDKKLTLKIYDYFLSFISLLLIIFFLFFVFKFNFKIYFYTFLSSLFFLILSFYSNQDLFNGFSILTGGNDGLVYNSYANNMFYYLKQLKIEQFLLGVEHVFYFPSSLRYFLSVFKIFFAETNYGYLTIGYILCMVVLMLFIKIFGLRYGLLFGFLVIGTRLFEGYGASIIKMLKHINASDAEPFAITIFFICLYIFIFFYENKDRKSSLLNFIFGFLAFITISLRPNFLPTVFLLVLIHIYFLYRSNRKREIISALLGFIFIFLIPLHNLYFGKQIVFLSSGHVHNTGASISTYLYAFNDILNLNFQNSANISSILVQVERWIKPTDLHYGLFFILLFFTFLTKEIYFKIISLLALSQHVVLLIFEPRGRYSYLAWFLTIIVVMFFIQLLAKYLVSRKCFLKKIKL